MNLKKKSRTRSRSPKQTIYGRFAAAIGTISDVVIELD